MDSYNFFLYDINNPNTYLAILWGDGEDEISSFLLIAEAGFMGVLNPSGSRPSILLSKSSHRLALDLTPAP